MCLTFVSMEFSIDHIEHNNNKYENMHRTTSIPHPIFHILFKISDIDRRLVYWNCLQRSHFVATFVLHSNRNYDMQLPVASSYRCQNIKYSTYNSQSSMNWILLLFKQRSIENINEATHTQMDSERCCLVGFEKRYSINVNINLSIWIFMVHGS